MVLVLAWVTSVLITGAFIGLTWGVVSAVDNWCKRRRLRRHQRLVEAQIQAIHYAAQQLMLQTALQRIRQAPAPDWQRRP